MFFLADISKVVLKIQWVVRKSYQPPYLRRNYLFKHISFMYFYWKTSFIYQDPRICLKHLSYLC